MSRLTDIPNFDDPEHPGNKPLSGQRRLWLQRKAHQGTELFERMETAMSEIGGAHQTFAALADDKNATAMQLLVALNDVGRKSQALLDIMLGDDAPDAFPDIFAGMETGPDFADGPEFEGWAERAGRGD